MNLVQSDINSEIITSTELVEVTKEYASQAKAFNTIKSYRSDWNYFQKWCADNGTVPLPASPETVALYLSFLAQLGRKSSTLRRKISSISQAHQAAGYENENPAKSNFVRTVMAGIRRTIGSQEIGKTPAVTEVIREMLDTLGERLIDHRDRALLLIGFTGAFRRSELVSLDVEDVDFTREGLVITLRRSKTDQEGEGRKIGIAYGSYLETCPVRSLQCYIEETGLKSGPLFRAFNRHGQIGNRLSGQAVARIVQQKAKKAGLDPKRFGGHSLRSGLATSAAEAGLSERAIMKQTGHQSIKMVRRYIREGSLFKDNVTGKIGLSIICGGALPLPRFEKRLRIEI